MAAACAHAEEHQEPDAHCQTQQEQHCPQNAEEVRFIYRHILENRRDGLVSGLVRIGTDVTAILLLPAWIMVSRV